MALSLCNSFSDCSQTDGTTTVKGQSPFGEIHQMNVELWDTATPNRDNDHMMMIMNAAYLSEEHFEMSKDGREKVVNSIMGQVLQNNVQAWCEDRRVPTTLTILFKDRSYRLHKYPLVLRSGYLKRELMDAEEARVPSSCPGGPEIFEMIANFCYGSTIEMEPSNVAELRCAAEYLEMSEDHGDGNLCATSDLYLTEVVLQSWQDTMVVLLHCQNLYPSAEDLCIVSRCIEALAFMACEEMTDPLEKTSRSEASFESQFWSDISANMRDSSFCDLWMDDLTRLSCGMFERVIAAIRRQGMQERYVSQAVVKFVDRWVFTSCTFSHMDGVTSQEPVPQVAGEHLPSRSNNDDVIQAVVRLLPTEKDSVPISFLFSLLRCVVASDSSSDCKDQLESRIASQLELATIADFLNPFKNAKDGSISGAEVSCMKRIVNSFMSQQRSLSDSSDTISAVPGTEVPENFYCAYAVSAVAKVWDEYLAEVARDLAMTPSKFAELIEVVPPYARATHDHLYRAIHVYLKVHPHFSQEERLLVCRILNCHKLSPEMCTHAVQNELMPLRMIVQAMFMQQKQTRSLLSGHLQCGGPSITCESLPPLSASGTSFRRNISIYHLRSDSFRSTRESSRSRHESLGRYHDALAIESFHGEDRIVEDVASLGHILKRDVAFRQAASLKAEYEATDSRLQNLEEEIASMKKKMDATVCKSTSDKRRSVDKKKRELVLTVVPDVSSVDSEDGVEVGVNFAARNRNGVSLLTKAIRLVSLGGFAPRKENSSGDLADELDRTQNILCGRRNNDPMKSKISIRSLGFHNYSCSASTAVKVKEPRRLSTS